MANARKIERVPGPTFLQSYGRVRLTQDFISALLTDFHANNGRNGPEAIEKVRTSRPDVYLKVLTMIVPKEHKVETTNALTGLTDTQLDLMIAKLMDHIESGKRQMVDVTPKRRGHKATQAMDEAIERDRLIADERGSTDE